MRLSNLLLQTFSFFLPPAIICTFLLYFYPPFLDCHFPPARPAEASCSFPGSRRDAVAEEIAPFRLLAFGDPQLEGDSSLPPDRDDDGVAFFPRVGRWGKKGEGALRGGLSESWSAAAVRQLVVEDVPRMLQRYRKRVDLWGNDFYLAHIYRSLAWWTQPTHVVVLGDLLGSQHIGDAEFQRRSERFWDVVFAGAEKVPRTVTDVSARTEVLGQDERWRKRLITIAGNHDIGYAGDIDEHRLQRFEDAFGRVNWAIRFRLEQQQQQQQQQQEDSTSPHTANPSNFDEAGSPLSPITPELHLIILNSMNLDTPALNPALQNQTHDFLIHQLYNPITTTSTTTSTAKILLTHIPLHKEAGNCPDAPFFDYFPGSGGIREQNHLSQAWSEYILNGLTQQQQQHENERGGNAIILNGHDHEGCDTLHYRHRHQRPRPPQHPSAGTEEAESDSTTSSSSYNTPWQHKPTEIFNAEPENNSILSSSSSITSLREITVRSMMGSYGGHAGFLSAWFDNATQEWAFAYQSCGVGVQHIWWGVHVLDLVVVLLGLAGLFVFLWEDMKIRTEDMVRLEREGGLVKLKGE